MMEHRKLFSINVQYEARVHTKHMNLLDVYVVSVFSPFYEGYANSCTCTYSGLEPSY
jgi:hypothetical protein